MKPARIIPRADHKVADLEPMFRDHHALLSGGSKLSEQMAGETKAATFNRSQPPTLSTSLKQPPAQVMCLSAKRADGSGSSMSGLPVHWTWGGRGSSRTITIDDIIGLADDTEYSVNLWFSEG